MYLREMGQVKLLDRAGEVEICKRIESAEDMTYCAIFESLTTMKRLSGLAERLRSEKVRLDKVVGVDSSEWTARRRTLRARTSGAGWSTAWTRSSGSTRSAASSNRS
jgi:hypothetical protein